jgi:protein-S-isoprenylcysteine O-methyltransferase Ste14
MKLVTLLVWACTCASFGWGVLRFFRRAPVTSVQTTLVARLGSVFALWQAIAIVRAPASLWREMTSLVLLVIALGLFWSAVRAVRACGPWRLTAIFEEGPARQLVCNGPYRYVRHPFYTSYTIFWFAGALAGGSFVSLVMAMIMTGMYLQAIRREERTFAVSPLASRYADYRRRTGAMLPGWRWRH